MAIHNITTPDDSEIVPFDCWLGGQRPGRRTQPRLPGAPQAPRQPTRRRPPPRSLRRACPRRGGCRNDPPFPKLDRDSADRLRSEPAAPSEADMRRQRRSRSIDFFGRQSELRLQAEVLALRHQLRVLERQVRCLRRQRVDRPLLTALSRMLPRPAWSALLVSPETLLCWHRGLIRRRWAGYRARSRPHRTRKEEPSEPAQVPTGDSGAARPEGGEGPQGVQPIDRQAGLGRSRRCPSSGTMRWGRGRLARGGEV